MSPEDIYESEKPEAAMRLLTELAEGGNVEAMFYLGHLADEMTPRNSLKAFNWYSKAAERGHLEAKHWMASFHYHGIGTAQDISRAVDLFRQCAEQGLDVSQWKLGQHLALEPSGKEESLRWLKLAAQQGHEGAQSLLAEGLEQN